MTKPLEVVLLLALPASGKSEVRKFLRSLKPEECREEFHIGPTLQLDDYPYVHFMHRIDDELCKRGEDYVFYQGPNRSFKDDFEWQTLIELINEDFDDLKNHRTASPDSAAQLLFDRLDRARCKAQLKPAMGELKWRTRCQIAEALEEECREELKAKNETCKQQMDGKTVFIEAARGGPNGSAFPLTPPHGYQFALQNLSNDILDKARILYVWVTPEDSRRKNIERGKPGEQGSILHHSVPMEVMLGQYGCDDMDYLMETSDKKHTVQVERVEEVSNPNEAPRYENRVWHVPVAKFDNRQDLTSFIRNENWNDNDVQRIRRALKDALGVLASF